MLNMNLSGAKRTKILLIAGILIALLFYPIVGAIAFRHRQPGVIILFISRLLIWLELVVLYFYALKIEKTEFLLWPEVNYGFWFYPASFAALYLLVIIAGIISNIPRFLGWHDSYRVMTQMLNLVNKNVALLFFSAITAGITEELIFRVYLVPRLQVLFKNKYMPVIVSAPLFGAIHYRYYNLKEVIFAFLFGVIFAIHYQMYRNIKVLIFTHAFVDLVAFFAYRVSLAHHHLPFK